MSSGASAQGVVAGVMDAARARLLAVQERVEGLATKARQVVDDSRAYGHERVAAAVSAAREAVGGRVARIVAARDEAVGFVLSVATSSRATAVGAWQELRTKGLRAVASDVVAALDAEGRARVLLDGGRSKLESTRALAGETAELAKMRARAAAERASEKASELRVAAKETVSQKSFQATAAGSAGGAAALGAGGAVAGLATGCTLGAASGVPLALLTFGLSIPVGAVLGGGAGVVVGSTVGAATGAVGGGAAGYGAYCKRQELRSKADGAFAKAEEGVELVKGKAVASVSYVKGAALAARARLGRAGTGGSDETL